MSISYSGIVNYGKATLPSVESFGTNMNILRDPPKMVMTRRRNKVSDTSSITQMVEESGDRACEAINVYARGVNPFTAVSYGNQGNNGGQRVNGFSSGGNAGQQASLIHKIGGSSIGGGSFRPPVVPPQSLLPLSRLPRTNTSQFTLPGFADFTKKMMCPQSAEYTKGVRKEKDTLRTFIRPTAVYQIETPIVEPFEVKYVIKNPTRISGVGGGVSGVRTMDLTQQYVAEPTKNIVENPMHANAHANIGSETTIRYSDNSHMNTERYIQDAMHNNVRSQMSQNIQITPLDEMVTADVRTKDLINVTYTAPSTHSAQQEYIHDDMVLQRSLPQHSSRTNQQSNIYVRQENQHHKTQKLNRPVATGATNSGATHRQQIDTISDRTYRLNPTVSAGGFEGKGTMPLQERGTGVPELQSERSLMNHRVMEMQMGRQ